MRNNKVDEIGAIRRDDYSILRDGIAGLQDFQRNIVELRYWDDLSVTEIAELLDKEWHEIKDELDDVCPESQE